MSMLQVFAVPSLGRCCLILPDSACCAYMFRGGEDQSGLLAYVCDYVCRRTRCGVCLRTLFSPVVFVNGFSIVRPVCACGTVPDACVYRQMLDRQLIPLY